MDNIDMESVIIKETQSGQVAQKLEKHILLGHFPLGRKIPSIRELSGRLNVSNQVVKSALEILERRNLILRKPRIGVFVNPKIASQQRELYLLSVRQHDNYGIDIVDYASQALSISNHKIWRNINLNTRLMSIETLNEISFRYELEKLRNFNLDCLLTSIYLPGSAKLYNDLPFPVVILGDYVMNSAADSTPPNHIVEDTAERAEFIVKAAAAAGCRKVVMVAGECPDCSWGKLLKEGGEKAAAKLGIDFRYVRHKPNHHKNTFSEMLKGERPDALAIDGFCNISSFIDRLSEKGFSPGQDIKIFADGEKLPGITFVEQDYRNFSRAIIDQVGRLIKNPSDTIGKVVLSGLIKRSTIRLK